MNLGIAAVFGEFLNLPLARTFELYELWCFLRLVRAGAEEFGPAGLDVRDLFISDAAGGVTLAAGAVTVPVGSGWKLCFQKQYREFWIEPERRGSYSRTMTPDVVAAHEPAAPGEPSRLIVLDAKYRIDEGLNDALSSIHTYRDALVQEADSGAMEGIVTAAYLLTPHVPVLGAGYRDTPMPGRLFHPGYRAGFRFGAVTLRPGMTVSGDRSRAPARRRRRDKCGSPDMDVLTPEQRQLNMSRIRGRDTKPELLLRRGLHAAGLRFRLHAPGLPGRPDLVFPRHRAAILVHGCFWHGHDCPMFKLPATRRRVLGGENRCQSACAINV